MKNKSLLAVLLSSFLLVSCSTNPTGEPVSTSTSQSAIDPFSLSFENEDVVYQGILKGILEDKDSQTVDSSGVISIYCMNYPSDRDFVFSDFPEIEIESFLEYHKMEGIGVLMGVQLKERTKENVNRSCFALIENQYVTYCYPRESPEYYVLPWTKPDWLEIVEEYQTKAPSSESEQSLYEQYEQYGGFDFFENDPNYRFDPKRHVPGYIWVDLKTTENQNGKVYTPSDFPEIEATVVVEQMSMTSPRRFIVIGIREQTEEATRESMKKLMDNDIVYFSEYYRMGGNNHYA